MKTTGKECEWALHRKANSHHQYSHERRLNRQNDLPRLPQVIITPWNKTFSPSSSPGSKGPLPFLGSGCCHPHFAWCLKADSLQSDQFGVWNVILKPIRSSDSWPPKPSPPTSVPPLDQPPGPARVPGAGGANWKTSIGKLSILLITFLEELKS